MTADTDIVAVVIWTCQAMSEMTGTDANLLGDEYPDAVKELVRRTLKLLDEHYQSELTGLTGCGEYSSTSNLWEWVDRPVTKGNMARSGIKTDFPCQEHSDIVDRPITESVSARVKNETMYPSYEHSDKQSVLVDIQSTESLMSRSGSKTKLLSDALSEMVDRPVNKSVTAWNGYWLDYDPVIHGLLD